jgi:hypothetical protein
MMRSRVRWMLMIVLMGVGTFLAAPEASAQNGTWHWGAPGFSAGMSPGDREQYLINQGLADPNVNYWTPFWGSSSDPNVYTGASNTGYQNTFAVNHDINANFGIPVIGYLDIFTPLFGTNERAIGSTISSVWNSIVSTVSSVWNSVTSLFQSDYTSYNSSGGYGGGGYDNSFSSSYSGYGSYGGGGGGGCFVGGTPVTMADGSTKPIESLKVGDSVLAYDVKNKVAVAAPVTHAIVHQDWKDRAGTVLINGRLRATGNHPFFANGRWVRADQLKVGDTLIRAGAGTDGLALTQANGKRAAAAAKAAGVAPIQVKSVKSLPGVDTVYNVEVGIHHDFFSGGVLVHNFEEEECD